MHLLLKLTLFTVAVALQLQFGESLKCYVCDTRYIAGANGTSKCHDTFDKNYFNLTHCDEIFNADAPVQKPLCLKISGKDSRDSSKVIVRTCVREEENEKICESIKVASSLEDFKCSKCSTDGCNSGSSLGISLAVTIISMATALAYNYA